MITALPYQGLSVLDDYRASQGHVLTSLQMAVDHLQNGCEASETRQAVASESAMKVHANTAVHD
jgi:hypothetical protein